MSRKISESHPAEIEMNLNLGFGDRISDWLESMSSAHDFRWMLAHADDGIIWGRFDQGRLVLSSDAALGDSEAEAVCPPLRTITLQRLRAIGQNAEVYLWRDGGEFKGRLIKNRSSSDGSVSSLSRCIDEKHILWGTTARELKDEFSLLTEEGLGIKQVIPLKHNGSLRGDRVTPRLHVRQYLEQDADTGAVRILTGRLVDLELGEAK